MSHDTTDKHNSHAWAVLDGDTPLFHTPGSYPPEYRRDTALEALWRAKRTTMPIQLLQGDCREMLKTLPSQSVQCVVTSPPYWGLRKYTDDPREIGNEPTPADYVQGLVAVFSEVWRVLRDDGTLWLNLGDAYANDTKWGGKTSGKHAGGLQGTTYIGRNRTQTGLPSKSLIGLPWRVAFALQDAGWILRSDIIWAKPNCMPESVTDRPTRSHEYLFLFAKNQAYYYDALAIAEPVKQSSIDRINQPTFDEQTGGPKDYGTTGVNTSRSMRKTLENFKKKQAGHGRRHEGFNERYDFNNPAPTRNKRTVWTIATTPYAGAHFATMPEALIEPCILAGSSAQACETCGAAWGRVVEREAGMVNLEEAARQQHRSAGAQTGGIAKVTLGVTEHVTRRDLGFVPRCTCTVNTGSAASIVLDPFGGSGTVARVANRFQRNAILIDLNQAYIELQEKRTDGVQVELFV